MVHWDPLEGDVGWGGGRGERRADLVICLINATKKPTRYCSSMDCQATTLIHSLSLKSFQSLLASKFTVAKSLGDRASTTGCHTLVDGLVPHVTTLYCTGSEQLKFYSYWILPKVYLNRLETNKEVSWMGTLLFSLPLTASLQMLGPCAQTCLNAILLLLHCKMGRSRWSIPVTYYHENGTVHLHLFSQETVPVT